MKNRKKIKLTSPEVQHPFLYPPESPHNSAAHVIQQGLQKLVWEAVYKGYISLEQIVGILALEQSRLLDSYYNRELREELEYQAANPSEFNWKPTPWKNPFGED